MDSEQTPSGDSSPLPDCPRCGKPVAFSAATGPYTGSVSPCGCSVPPDLLADLWD